AAHFPAHPVEGVLADRGQEAGEIDTVPGARAAGTEREAKEREAGVLMVEPPSSVLAVHDPGLGRVELQPDLRQPVPDRRQQMFRLRLAGAQCAIASSA